MKETALPAERGGPVTPGGVYSTVESSASTQSTTETEQADWSNRHPVNIRLSLPLPFGRYYLTVVAGKERRSPKRLQSERRKHPLVTTGNLVFLFFLGTLAGLAILGAIQFFGVILLEDLGIVVGS